MPNLKQWWYALLACRIFLPSAAGDGCFFASNTCPNPDIAFWLYKNNTPPLLLDPLALTDSDFRPRRPLKILLHGFHGNRDFSPNMEVRPALLQTQPVYVLSVEYGRLVRFPCYYPWAVQNTRIVAKCLAQFLDDLIAHGIYEPEDLHLIGFSLGAQVAGFAANYAKNRLRHITGLDPARPGFATENLAEKLDASDADFVDVVHTDPFLYSSLEPMGHVDFYPNLESLFQPGCSYLVDGRKFYSLDCREVPQRTNLVFFPFWTEDSPFYISTYQDLLGIRNCNHFRAPLYYAESITSKRGFWSFNCGDWLTFLLHRCDDYAHIPSTTMGYFVSENATGAYFLSTLAAPPFAKGPLIEVELQVSDNAEKTLDLQAISSNSLN